jgi:hypothetical protein
MQNMLDRFSIGIGDRFGHQGAAQLRALQIAENGGVRIAPVWNKSFREHSLIGTKPEMARIAADNAVKSTGWKGAYFVDADHVGLKNVDLFLEACDFFTIDVADSIGQPTDDASLEEFLRRWRRMNGNLTVPGVEEMFVVNDAVLKGIARRYLKAIKEAGEIYRIIRRRGLDGRNDGTAVAIGNALYPCGARRGKDSDTNDRSKVLGEVLEGSRLRWIGGTVCGGI